MKKYTLNFIFNENLDLVWLIKKIRPAWQAGYLNGIGGKFEDGEDSFDCATREVKEESNLDVFRNDWIPVGEYVGIDYIVYINTILMIDEVFIGAQQLTDESIYTVDVSSITNMEIPILLSARTAIIASKQKLLDGTMDYMRVNYM